MTPLVPFLVGVTLLGVGIAVLRSFGPRYRVGRLLAATPIVTVAEALALADGPRRYVGVQGRIDAEEEFEDDARRPLVLRRTRIQIARGGSWTTVDEDRRAVAFEIREGLDAIGVDGDALDDGLVVTPRESTGIAADLGDRVPAGTAPSTPARLRVEQLSSVEHAIVLGVPTRVAGGGPIRMRAGLGRPLILTTLEPAEAMRVLTGGRSRRPLAAALAFVTGGVALTIAVLWAALGAVTGTAAAATPVPTAAVAGDPRSSGVGPGLVGEPLLAVGLVLAIGLVATIGTLAYVRLTEGSRR